MTKRVAQVFNRVLVVSMGLVLLATGGGFWILSLAHEQQVASEARGRIESLIDVQVSEFTAELVNERFFAIQLRTDAITRQFASEGIGVGLYRPDGAPIFESDVAETVRTAAAWKGGAIDWAAAEGYVAASRALQYSNETIGYVLLVKPLVRASAAGLQEALYLTLLLQALAFILVFVATRYTTNRVIVRPLHRLIQGIPSIGSFVSGDSPELGVPIELGTVELDEVSAALRDGGHRLRSAVGDAQTAKVAAERHEAIARTTQMLAHDVRKPFSLLRLGLDLIDRESDPIAMRTLVARLVPEVGRAMQSINGMLVDIMELGVDAAPQTETVAIAALLDASMKDVFRDAVDATIAFEYRFAHTAKIDVNPSKVVRVMANILGNAQEAIRGPGRIWIATRDVTGRAGQHFVEVTIGNSGPLIAPADLPRLFDAFFTSGKSGGTGLGLAIASKTVRAHGGEIRCESNERVGTAFTLTLPADSVRDEDAGSVELPLSAEQIRQQMSRRETPAEREASSEAALRAELDCELRRFAAPIRLLLVDDEPLYLAALEAKLTGDPQLAGHLVISKASSAAAAEAILQSQPVDLCICDIDLGRSSADGYAVVSRLRALQPPAYVCVHSNRSSDNDHQLALDAGADVAFPKPMPVPQLLKFLINASVRRREALVRPIKLLVVDDDPFVLSAWQSEPAFHVTAAPSLADLRSKLDADPDLFLAADALVTDFYLDEDETGFDVVDFVRERTTCLPIILASDVSLKAEDAARFDARIEKVSIRPATVAAAIAEAIDGRGGAAR